MPRSFRTGPFDRRGGVDMECRRTHYRDAPGDDNAPPDDEPAPQSHRLVKFVNLSFPRRISEQLVFAAKLAGT